MTTTTISTAVADKHTHHRLIILGSGPAGYTAAVYAARANLAPTLIAGAEQGGQLVKTAVVDNWPGDFAGVTGYDLMQRMQQHAERFATEIIYDHISKVDIQRRPFLLVGAGESYTCDALIVATGASPKYLGLAAEHRLLGKGVSTCATCDGYFYKGAKVAVIGGGNTAVEEALYLATIAKEVVLIHRRNAVTAEPVLAAKLHELVQQGKIRVLWQHVVADILGSEEAGVTGLLVKDLVSGQVRSEEMKGVFIAVGFKPNSEVFAGQLEMFEDGYIKVPGGCSASNGFTATSVPGVFAAGDIANRSYRQAITAAAMGCVAAIDANRYLLG